MILNALDKGSLSYTSSSQKADVLASGFPNSNGMKLSPHKHSQMR
jgi:hypothetical protein